MRTGLVLAVVALSLSNCIADIEVNDYIFWKKADILAWDQYFPSRALAQEQLTNTAAVAAVNSLASGLNSTLSKVVAFQAQELETAQLLMAGTDAEGCVGGIADYMSKAIADEVATYDDCAADTLSKLSRLNKAWAKVSSNYQTAYKRALNGIDVCARNYPNKDSIDRLKSCVESMNNNYFTVANATQSAMSPSPSMTYFQQVVVECTSDAVKAVADKGTDFLKKLGECAALDSNIDLTSYAEELGEWKGYTDTLASQISQAQAMNVQQVQKVDTDMQSYYKLQKEALEKYVIESRGAGYYLSRMYSYLSDYYNAVISGSVDNPGDPACASAATSALNQVASISAAKSLTCDLAIVNNTVQLINGVRDSFLFLNRMMPATGNVALLNCFVQGYVFAPNTISNCFNLIYSGFEVEYEERHVDIVKNVDVLHGYEQSFFSGSDLPCGGTSLQRAYLGAEVALYNMQRCLYTTPGTTYSVTTPLPPPATPPATPVTTSAPANLL